MNTQKLSDEIDRQMQIERSKGVPVFPVSATKSKCKCREEVNALVDNGNLRAALNHSHSITNRAEDSLVRQACDRKSLRGRFIDNGEVRNALSYAGWNQNHIDFLLYRSQHEHESKGKP